MSDNNSVFDNLETQFNYILVLYDSDFDETYPNKEKFYTIINRTKKKGKITQKDIVELRELVQKFQDDFIIKWCTSLTEIINKRKRNLLLSHVEEPQHNPNNK